MMISVYDSPPLVPLSVQWTCFSIPAMLPQLYRSVPDGDFTSMLLMLMFLHTVGLEHCKYPISGSYFLLVVPLKFLIVISEMVSLEGNWLQSVMFFWP